MAATSWEMQLRNFSKNKKREKRFEISRPKRKVRRPPWDDTSSDLSVYKPTTAELERRHQQHKPKLLSERKYLQQYQDLLLLENKENLVSRKTFYKSHVEQQKAIIKEIFSNQEMELSNVLAETDRAMANVKDLFGDDPMKFKAIPHITDAPHSNARLNGSLLAIDVQTPSRLTALSDSVMRHPAINDVTSNDYTQESDHSSDDSKSDECCRDDQSNAISYQSNFDFDYYKKLLQREQSKEDNFDKDRTEVCPSSDQESSKFNMEEVTKKYPGKSSGEEHEEIAKNVLTSNNLGKSEFPHKDNEELRTIAAVDSPPTDQDRNKNSPLDKFDQMKKEIQFLLNQQENTLPLVVFQPIIQIIRELSNQLELERGLREHLAEEFQEQRTLIDALTGDLIYSQEENEKLKSEFESFKREARNEISRLKDDLQRLCTNKMS